MRRICGFKRLSVKKIDFFFALMKPQPLEEKDLLSQVFNYSTRRAQTSTEADVKHTPGFRENKSNS